MHVVSVYYGDFEVRHDEYSMNTLSGSLFRKRTGPRPCECRAPKRASARYWVPILNGMATSGGSWIVCNVRCPRLTLASIAERSAVQTKGLGAGLCSAR